eukprot:CAMPEP_0197423280 /NCGR_PEP_ID=MMETSP1170-20131217/20599_1 /TAXON_ID=54406 /ORGANISM="Sarcinochrysis sp, Strain CCMP770" /LENGTH=181 /DNA_ID=CAMNT_0042950685 /DNA_START=40 /DNA_END=585 /DNA_ORIENTATION=+
MSPCGEADEAHVGAGDETEDVVAGLGEAREVVVDGHPRDERGGDRERRERKRDGACLDASSLEEVEERPLALDVALAVGDDARSRRRSSQSQVQGRRQRREGVVVENRERGPVENFAGDDAVDGDVVEDRRQRRLVAPGVDAPGHAVIRRLVLDFQVRRHDATTTFVGEALGEPAEARPKF